MSTYSLSHLADSTLLRDLAALVARDRATTAALLAHLAEVDERKLYLPAAYPSMYAYCVGELRMSEDTAYKRIRAARAARRFPTIFAAVAEGRVNLNAVVMLAPHLTQDTFEVLLACAVHKTKSEIEQLLATRFPRPDLPTVLEASGSTPSPVPPRQLAPGPVEPPAPHAAELSPGIAHQLAARPVEAFRSERVALPAPARIEAHRPRVAPLAPERFALQVTIGQSTHDKLRHAQALLGHQVPSGDVAQVLDRAFDALIEKLERAKVAATTRPRRGHRRSASAGRYVPADIRRAVWNRDGGRCTFVSNAGTRCPARERLEFDHVDEVARGGEASIGRVRLRCRAHNQYGAELTFGAGFMKEKRRRASGG